MADTRCDIEKYTICLYREKFSEPIPIGSGILVCLREKYYIVSAYHVFDMEDELLEIQNDPEEEGIQHDDMDGIMAKSGRTSFYIDNFMKAMVGTFYYDEKTKQPFFNEDTEWCICELSDEMVKLLREADKTFYNIQDLEYPQIDLHESIIVSGYPKYAQDRLKCARKEPIEKYRSFYSRILENDKVSDPALLRVHFENNHAYNIEHEEYIKIPQVDGIAGMSGGGFWYKQNDRYIPVGIILKQDPNENFIEGYRLDYILKEYFDKNHDNVQIHDKFPST